MTVIDGEFKRVGRRAKKARKSSLGASSGSWGTDIWEATHPGEVQTENVILTGTNRPNAADENPVYDVFNPGQAAPTLPQGIADVINNPLGNLQTLLVIGIVLLFVVPAILKED